MMRYGVSLNMRAASMPGTGQAPQFCNRHCGRSDFTQKDIPVRREGLSFCRPILGSGDFQGLCMESMQIEKKSSILGLAVAEQVP